MITGLIVVKILVTMCAVVGLSMLAEHVSPRAAGVLAGFPHGIAIVLFFIAVEQGTDFASQAASFAVAGLGANVLLAFSYAMVASKFPGKAGVAPASVAAICVFFLVTTGLNHVSPGLVTGALITFCAIGVVWLLLRNQGSGKHVMKPAVGGGELALRATIAALIVVLITGLAALLGPERAGLLAGFPVVTFPLLVLLHARHGGEIVVNIVRHYPKGIISLLVFTLSVSWGFTVYGAGMATVVGLILASLYLGAATMITHRKTDQ